MKITYAIAQSGCAWWRCVQPAKIIKKQELADIRIISPDASDELSEELLMWGDVIVHQSPMGINMVVAAAKLQSAGKTVVGDYDDLTFSCSPFNPAYKSLGLNEVKVNKEGKEVYLWQDGRDDFSIKANYFRYKSLQDLLKNLSGVTTTCQFIKNKYKDFSDNIYIVPNSIDFSMFKPFPKKDTGRVRIGWTASDSHYADIWMVKRIMRRIINKYKDKVLFVEMGNLMELKYEFKPNELEMHSFVGLDIYPLKLAALNLDIGICPLDNTEFNRGKSQLKWSEFASLRIPSVCSKLEPYDCVEDGRTGMVAATEDEFFEKLCILIDDVKLRDKISHYAYDKNYEDYNLEKNAVLWIDAFEQAMEAKCEFASLDKGQSVKDIPRI